MIRALLLGMVLIILPGSLGAVPRDVRVGVFQAPPLVMVENGKPRGLFIELVEEFARTNGWHLIYVDQPWPQQLEALERGDIDLLPAIGHTKEREARYDFSDQPVFIDSGVLFSGPRLVVHTLFDLEGKRVAALEKSIFTSAFLANLEAFGIHCILVPTRDNQEVMAALANGTADAGVSIYSLGTYLARRYPVSITPISFSPLALQFGVPKGKNADLVAAIDGAMAVMRPDNDSVYSRAYQKWTVPPDLDGFFPWIWWGLGSLAGLGLLLGAWTFLLRREVAAKTAYLLTEKEKLAVTLRSIGDGVITTDTGGRVELMNTVAEDLCGWSQDLALGRPLHEVFVVVQEGTDLPCPNPVERVLSTGATTELSLNTVLVARDGTRRTIADSGAPILDGKGKTLGVVLVFRDTTERQKTLDALQRSDKLNSLGVLAGGIAHDFNNLLAGVFGYIELAKRAGESLPAVVTYLNKALSVSSRAKGLAHQLLTFSKGGLPLRKTGALGPLITSTVAFATSGSNIRCRVDVAADLWTCAFDPDQLGQVFDNLIINARQAMPQGGEVVLGATNLDVPESGALGLKAGRYVRVSLTDKGCGIPAGIQAHIFDPFFTTKETGHGLGLAMCNSIVRNHDGAIDFQTAAGEGTTFHVYLPAAFDQVAAPVVPGSSPHQGTGTILVLDDEEFLRDIMKAELGGMGYQVLAAADGQALQALDAEADPWLAFLDLTIPGAFGGREVAKVLRRRYPGIRLIAFSGFSDDPVMAKPTDYGFDASLRKPFERRELVAILDQRGA